MDIFVFLVENIGGLLHVPRAAGADRALGLLLRYTVLLLTWA